MNSMQVSNKRPKVCGNKCVVCGKSKFSHAGLKLFIFPRKDEARCEKWIISTGYFELKYLPLEAKRYVCELHFDDKDFMSVLRNRLMPNAVPKQSNTQHRISVNRPTRCSTKQNNQILKGHDSAETENTPRTNQQYESESPHQLDMSSKNIITNQEWSGNTYGLHFHDLSKQTASHKDIVPPVLDNCIVNVEPYHGKKKMEFVPMIQPYYKRNCRPAPCKHCKRKDKTITSLRKRVRELKRIPFRHRIDHLKNISNDSKTFAKMFLTHASHRVWTEEEKTFAIDLLNKSSSAYYFLRHNKKLILPSKASVQSWIKERTKETSEETQSQELSVDNTINVHSEAAEIQPIQHISTSIVSTLDNLLPMTCSMEMPMVHPNDNIISIPEITNDIPSHVQTMTTLEPMHRLTMHSDHSEPTQLSSSEPHYKYAYQIITHEGISNKSTYIIHLNES